jgi:hypothetical protein
MLSLRLRENDPARLAWDGLIACIALLTMVMLPLALLRSQWQHRHHITSTWWLVFAVFGLIDLGLNLITSYEHEGLIIKDRRAILHAYLRGMAPVDLLANLPVLLLPATAAEQTALALLPLLRSVRLLFLTNRWQHLNLVDIRLLRISRYGVGILMLTHWMACLWLWVGLSESSTGGWINRADLQQTSFSHLYETALFWTVTLVTVGYGEILPQTPLETRVAMLLMAGGLLIYTFAIANMLELLKSLDNGRSAYSERQAMLSRFLAFNGVSGGTIKRVRRFNDYQWAHSRGLQTPELFAGLPAELRSEITMEMMHDALANVPLLALAPAPLQKRLLAVLELVTYPPGTVVLDIDEPGERLVFITRGAAVIDTTASLPADVRHFGAGDYVGDLSFFLRERRNCRVVADSYVVAFLLSRSVFETLRQEEPHLQSLLQQIAATRSERNQALVLAGVVV